MSVDPSDTQAILEKLEDLDDEAYAVELLKRV